MNSIHCFLQIKVFFLYLTHSIQSCRHDGCSRNSDNSRHVELVRVTFRVVYLQYCTSTYNYLSNSESCHFNISLEVITGNQLNMGPSDLLMLQIKKLTVSTC